MRKTLLAVVMLVTGTAVIWCIGFSFSVSGGYGFGLDGEVLGTKVELGPGGYEDYQNRFIGPGQSGKVFGEADIALTDTFSVAVGAGYLLGDPWETPFATLVVEQGPKREAWVRTSFIPLSLTLKGRAPAGRFSFDFGVGPSMGILATSKVTDRSFGSGVPDEYWEVEGTYTTGWGFHGIAGAEFRFTDWLALRAQVRGEQLTFKPKRAVITKYTVDGVDRLLAAYPDVADVETIYVDDLDDYLNSPADPNAPRQELAYNISADTIGLFLGIVLRIP